MMRILILFFILYSLNIASFAQANISDVIAAVNNYSVVRLGHRNVSFTVSEDVLREVRRKRVKYSRFFASQLQDTSKTIVAHVILTRLWSDTFSVSERIFFENDVPGGLTYTMNELVFRKYLTGRLVVEVNSMAQVLHKWKRFRRRTEANVIR